MKSTEEHFYGDLNSTQDILQTMMYLHSTREREAGDDLSLILLTVHTRLAELRPDPDAIVSFTNSKGGIGMRDQRIYSLLESHIAQSEAFKKLYEEAFTYILEAVVGRIEELEKLEKDGHRGGGNDPNLGWDN